jgi:hypothetical protein
LTALPRSYPGVSRGSPSEFNTQQTVHKHIVFQISACELFVFIRRRQPPQLQDIP